MEKTVTMRMSEYESLIEHKKANEQRKPIIVHWGTTCYMTETSEVNEMQSRLVEKLTDKVKKLENKLQEPKKKWWQI